MKTICLNCIIRNESAIIERCLNSLVNHIDYWVIVDTGSTDNTIQIVKDFFTKHNIPGELHERPWLNFEHNRNEGLYLAKGKSDYILLIDADMELVVTDNKWKEKIPFDTCSIKQKNNTIFYYNIRLINGNLQYKYTSITHEYIECIEQHSNGKSDIIYMNDYGDGGYKSDKFKRDIELLESALLKDPNNPRYAFYLAESYRNLDKKDIAIEWYKKRVDIGGWKEEVWMALLNIGRCYQGLGNWTEALNYYLRAFNFYDKRAEPIYEIAKYYRENNMPVLGYYFAKMGAEVPYPSNDVLFIEDPVYQYLLKYELSVCVCYINDLKQGKRLCDELIFHRDTPDWIRDSCHSNLFFYLEKLEGTSIQELTTKKTNPNFNFCNPSILYTENHHLINIREVSYTFDIDKNIYHYDNTIDTYNHIIDCKRQSGHVLPQITECDISIYKNYITGLEDLRLFEMDNDVWAIGTCRITNENGVNEMIAIQIGSDYKINKAIKLKGLKDDECQKNWVPINYNRCVHFLYSSDPLILLKPDFKTGECVPIFKTSRYNLSSFRGSSQIINFEEGYLYIVHEVIHKDNRRYYYHRFVYMDNDLEIKKISEPFYFINKTIEYCSGLAKVGNELHITIGYEDKRAYLIKIGADKVVSLINAE